MANKKKKKKKFRTGRLSNNVQSLAKLLDAPSIFSTCILLWVHVRHSLVTIVAVRRDNMISITLVKSINVNFPNQIRYFSIK